MKYCLNFTLDYEIHGNGDGNPWKLMVEPTNRLMNLLENYGQRLIIMADVAEILSFKHYLDETGEDAFYVNKIESQLQDAIRRGHDVQLHIHSSWFNSQWNGKRWDQCIEEYNLASLSLERIDYMVSQCVQYLQELLKPVKSDYKVWLFRAANWSMMPTARLYEVLVRHGITADTSVYKGGVQGGNVSYDYREAYHNLLSYPASSTNINYRALDNQVDVITEYPIYTEMRPFWAFVSPIRLFRIMRAKFHRHKQNEAQNNTNSESADNRRITLRSFFRKNPWKLDFNQATGGQLISAMKRIMGQNYTDREQVDIVLIGHSKSFLPYNEVTLEKFLKWLVSQPSVCKNGY